MGAKCYAQGFAVGHSEGDPEVIDVARNFVGFRGEGDRYSRHADEVSIAQLEVSVLTALAMSVWQSEIEDKVAR
jgi:hypothetical protein